MSGRPSAARDPRHRCTPHPHWLSHLGPGPGTAGGRLVFGGPPAGLAAARSTLTGEHLAAYVGT